MFLNWTTDGLRRGHMFTLHALLTEINKSDAGSFYFTSSAGQYYDSFYLLLAPKIEDLEKGENVLQLERIVVHFKQRFLDLSNEWWPR